MTFSVCSVSAKICDFLGLKLTHFLLIRVLVGGFVSSFVYTLIFLVDLIQLSHFEIIKKKVEECTSSFWSSVLAFRRVFTCFELFLPLYRHFCCFNFFLLHFFFPPISCSLEIFFSSSSTNGYICR